MIIQNSDANLEYDSEEEEIEMLENNLKEKDDNGNIPTKYNPNELATQEVDDSGCCYGWLGMRFIADKIASVFWEDPIETLTAGIFFNE